MGKMIIPVSLMNSGVEACAEDVGCLAEALMDGHELPSGGT